MGGGRGYKGVGGEKGYKGVGGEKVYLGRVGNSLIARAPLSFTPYIPRTIENAIEIEIIRSSSLPSIASIAPCILR